MQRKRIALALAAIVLTTATPAAAQTAQTAQPYSNLFVFGDSLVDSGNAQAGRAAAGGDDPAPAAQGYFEGRFSNGYNFADYLSFSVEGGPARASAFGGRNFSVGGAQAAEVVGDASPSFVEQIGLFDASGKAFDSSSLVLITLGGNDVRGELAKLGTIAGYTPTLSPAVTALTDGLTSLYARGARNFIVTGLPDIGQIPAVALLGSSALSTAGTQLSFGLNQLVGQTVGGLATQTGANFQFFDLFSYQQTIYANPAAYGLPTSLNTRDACLRVAGAAPACTGYVYFDTIHPTTQVHRAIATGLTGQLGLGAVPEPVTWAMMIVGIGMTGGALRHRRRRVAHA